MVEIVVEYEIVCVEYVGCKGVIMVMLEEVCVNCFMWNVLFLLIVLN